MVHINKLFKGAAELLTGRSGQILLLLLMLGLFIFSAAAPNATIGIGK